MTIRQRASITIVAAVTIMLLVFSILIYYLLVNAHIQQFRDILKDKAIQTIKLLEEVKEVDSTLLSIIDANTLHELRNEKTIVLDSNGRILYSSSDDHQISWDDELLQSIKNNKELYFTEGEYETACIFYGSGNIQRYVLVAAKDTGRAGLFMKWIGLLAISTLVILLIILVTAYFFAGRALNPLTKLQHHIQQTSDSPGIFAELPDDLISSKDEIASLAISYNLLMNKLQQYDTNQKQFIRYASHELRTPLAVLMSQIDLALLRQLNGEEYRELLNSLREEHRHLSDLISRLLLLFRSDQPFIEDQLTSFSLYELVENSLDKIQKQFTSIRCSIEFLQPMTDPEDYSIRGDEVLLQSVMDNLLSNAVKYGEESPITVALDVNDKNICLEVLNGGPLIPEEDVERLFQPFFRAGNKGKQAGSGLGLVLVKKVVTLHKGTIQYRVSEQKNSFLVNFCRHNMQNIK